MAAGFSLNGLTQQSNLRNRVSYTNTYNHATDGEALNDAAKVLYNVDEAKMAADKAHELNYIIKAIEKF